MTITAAQVKQVLTAVADDQIVDIPAKHDERGYWIELQELSFAFKNSEEGWYKDIAKRCNQL